MSSVQQNVIKRKFGLLNLPELGNVYPACKVMGFFRDTCYCYQAAEVEGGIEALLDANRRKLNPKNLVEEATEAAVVSFVLDQQAFGQVRVSNELRKEAGPLPRLLNCYIRRRYHHPYHTSECQS